MNVSLYNFDKVSGLDAWVYEAGGVIPMQAAWRIW